MIKMALRPNLIYPMQLIIWTFLRKITSILISKLFELKSSIIYTFLMFLGEIIGGFVSYKYQKSFIKNKPSEYLVNAKFSFVISSNEMNKANNEYTIKFLIFISSFFDFFEFIISTYYLGKILKISKTLQIRLGGFLIVVSFLVCSFVLNFNIFKHHSYSIIIIIISWIILIICEFFFQKFDIYITRNELTLAIFFSFLSHTFVSINNCVEKYLMDFNFLNPFLLLANQGIIGFIFTIICSFFENPIPELKNLYKNNSIGAIMGFVSLLLLYFIFGALKNIYRMCTNMLFSPMYKNLADYIINPIYIIYYFTIGEDFLNERERNYFYFFVNIIILIIFDFFGLVYNEFIALFFCGLEQNTYKSVNYRAQSEEMDSFSIDEDEDVD